MVEHELEADTPILVDLPYLQVNDVCVCLCISLSLPLFLSNYLSVCNSVFLSIAFSLSLFISQQ